jgi:hypothetical protein
MSLGDLYEIMSWEPIGELDPFRLSVRMQVSRTVFTICMKPFLDDRLGRTAALERKRERVLDELLRDLKSARQPDGAAADPQARTGKTGLSLAGWP